MNKSWVECCGRIDASFETNDNVYIFEYKLDKDAKTALAQIHKKKYYEKYQGSGKKITLIGANFSSEAKNIDDWKLETL